MALLIACDIHPLNNLRVQKYLKSKLGAEQQAVVTWMNRWISDGFSALERQLSNSVMTGACCFGDQPGLADCCLVPQVYNAERFGCDLSPFPLIRAITAHCRTLAAFAQAAPERQPDAPVG
jgi:maleylacetoacetate isomerase